MLFSEYVVMFEWYKARGFSVTFSQAHKVWCRITGSRALHWLATHTAKAPTVLKYGFE